MAWTFQKCIITAGIAFVTNRTSLSYFILIFSSLTSTQWLSTRIKEHVYLSQPFILACDWPPWAAFHTYPSTSCKKGLQFPGVLAGN